MKIRMRWRGMYEEIDVAEGSSVLDLLKKFGLCREVVIVIVNGRIVPEENLLKEGDEVVIRSIVTGG